MTESMTESMIGNSATSRSRNRQQYGGDQQDHKRDDGKNRKRRIIDDRNLQSAAGGNDDPETDPGNDTAEQQQEEQCTIEPFDDDNYSPEDNFQNTAVIEFAHSNIPRFGHSSDITTFVVGSQEEAKDYRQGLTSSTIAILVVATTWIVTLGVCKYGLGRQRCGWLSGRFRPIPPRPSQSLQTGVVESKTDATVAPTSQQETISVGGGIDGGISSKQIDDGAYDDTANVGGGGGGGGTNVDSGVDSEQPLPPSVDVANNNNKAHQEDHATTSPQEEPSFLNLLEQFGHSWFGSSKETNSKKEKDSTVGEAEEEEQNYDSEHLQQQKSPTSSEKNAMGLQLIHDLDSAFHTSFTASSTVPSSHKDKDVAQDRTTTVTDNTTADSDYAIAAAVAASTTPTLRTSGQVVTLTPPIHDNDEVDKAAVSTDTEQQHRQEEEVWLRHYHRTKRMHTWFKVICWWCALAVIVGTILQIIIGIDYLKTTIQNGKTSLDLAQDLVLEASDLIQGMNRGIERVQNDTVALLLSLNGICPLVRERVCSLTTEFSDDSICESVDSTNVTLLTLFDEWREGRSNNNEEEDDGFEIRDDDDDLLSNETTSWDNDTMSFLDDDFDFETASSTVVDAATTGTACKGSGIGTNIACNTSDILSGVVAERLARHYNTTTWLQSELYSLSDDLESAYELIENAKTTAKSFDWALSLALFFMVLSASIGLFLLCSLTFQKKFSSLRLIRHVQYRWIFPLFMFFIVLSLIMTCVFILGSMAVADMCVDGPDERVLEIAAKYSSQGKIKLFASRSAYDFIRFYLSKCDEPPPILNLVADNTGEADELALGLEEELNDLSLRVTETCGTDESGALFLAVFSRTLRDYLCGITNLVRSFRELVRCSNIYPLYEQIMHQTVCFAGSESFWYIAATNFFVVMMALILMTFRSAFFEIGVETPAAAEEVVVPPDARDDESDCNVDEDGKVSSSTPPAMKDD